MRIIKRTARSAAALLLAVLIVAGCLFVPGTTLTAKAKSKLTSIGLAELALTAYRDGWEYIYGAYGNKTDRGTRAADCSGLIYAYLCWDNGTVKPNWNMPRTVTQQVNRSSVSGSIENLPRTHGLLITNSGARHVGVYVGNGMVADASSWDVDMRYASINKHGWTRWHKLDCITYPTNGWYVFDGDHYYYEDGQYVVNTTRTIDGVSYTFGSDGVSDRSPDEATNGGYDSSTANMNAKVTAGVRLRKGPGTDYGTITTLSDNTRVNVISKKYDGWYAVETGSGLKGYVSSQYVKITGTVTESDDLPSFEKPEKTDKPVSGEGAKVTTAVHLRSSKSTSSASLGVIAAGTAVTVTDKSDNSWYQVSVNGKTGYMFREYVRLNSAPAETSKPASGNSNTKRSAVTTAGVFLRSGKGTNYSQVALLEKDTKVTVTDTANSEWYGVTADGKKGYVSSRYLALSEEAAPDNTESENTQPTKPADTASAWTSTGVYLRSGKGTTYASVALLNAYTPVTVTDTSDSTWYGVTADGKKGYVYSQYIKTGKLPNTDSNAESMTTTAYLNLRESDDASSRVLLVIPENASVSVAEKTSDDWYKVTYGGKTGFVSTQYLK